MIAPRIENKEYRLMEWPFIRFIADSAEDKVVIEDKVAKTVSISPINPINVNVSDAKRAAISNFNLLFLKNWMFNK